MKRISIVVPTYNEELNVIPMKDAIVNVFNNELSNYEYEIIFIDNCSKDSTRDQIKKICNNDEKCFAIFNARNFGAQNSVYYGILQATGDAVILICADFQEPVEMIPKFVKEWESGYRIVAGKKIKTNENCIISLFRKLYYTLMRRMSDFEFIEQFIGFGLYDKSFVNILKNLKDSTPYLRGIVAELGYKIKVLEYEQQKRRFGKSSYNFYSYYDTAMLSFTSYTKIGLRMATFIGFFLSLISLIISIAYIVLKITCWERYTLGTASIAVGLFFFNSVQLMFIGFLGEYILSMNQRLMNRPLVIEESRYGIRYNNIEREVHN